MSLVSVNAQDLARVVALACLTEDRENAEQRSLLAVAERLDRVLDRDAGRKAQREGSLVVRDGVLYGDVPAASRYEADADGSRDLGDGQRRVKTSWERKGKPPKDRATK